MTLNRLLANLRRFGRRFLGVARPSFNPIEGFVVAQVLEALPGADARVLKSQLNRLDLIQRSPGGRITAVYLEIGEDLPHLSNAEPEHLLAELLLESAGRTLEAAVMSHRGYISSIEFHGSPERLTTPVLRVISLHGVGRGAVGAVDRLEHGRHA